MVVPLLGPSTPRDAVGGMIGVGVPGSGVLFAVNGRARADEQIETAKRDAYLQSDGEGNWWDDSPISAALSEELYEGTTETDLEVTVNPGPASPGAIEARHREARRQRESRAEEPQLRRRAQCAASTRSACRANTATNVAGNTTYSSALAPGVTHSRSQGARQQPERAAGRNPADAYRRSSSVPGRRGAGRKRSRLPRDVAIAAV